MASPAPAVTKKGRPAALTTAKKLRTPGKPSEALSRIVVPKLRLGSAEPSLPESSKQDEAEALASSKRPQLSTASLTKQSGNDSVKGQNNSSATQSSSLAGQSPRRRGQQVTATTGSLHLGQNALAEVTARRSARQAASAVVLQLGQGQADTSLLSSPDYSPGKRSRQAAEAPVVAEDSVPLACQTAISKRR